MNGEDERFDNDLDGLLDDALASYTPYEPQPGLEKRILLSLPAARFHPARVIGGQWAVAAVLLALIVTVSFWFKSARVEITIVRPPAAPVVDGFARSPEALLESTVSARRVSHPVTGRPVLKAPAGREPAPVATRDASSYANETMAFAPFAPIVIKPIVMAPMRMGTGD